MRNSRIRCFTGVLILCGLLCGCGAEADGLVPVGESGVPVWEDMPETAAGGYGREETSARKPGTAADAEETSWIYVYVCGAVNSPGVVALPEGSRAEAALEAAGGLREDAQTDLVNLAARVADGEKLYFPRLDEAAEVPEAGEGLININTADAETLCTLSGIGESRARDILRYREEHGFFESREDIMKVPGIKNSVYNRIKDRIKTE